MNAVAERIERDSIERLAWTAYGLAERFPGGPLGGKPETALADWTDTLFAAHGSDERTTRAANTRREAIDRATLNAYLASPEARAALKARPGFGLAGTAILPPTPRRTALRNGSVGFRVIAPYPEADTPPSARIGRRIPTDPGASGYVPVPTEGHRARTVRLLATLQRQHRAGVPITPDEASFVIDWARKLRHEADRAGLASGVALCDRLIERARRAQYSARPA
jgi:hypothetical protein